MNNRAKEIKQELKEFYDSCLSIPYDEFLYIAKQLDAPLYEQYSELKPHITYDDLKLMKYKHICKRMIIKVCVNKCFYNRFKN